MRYHLTSVKIAIIKKPQANAGEGVERRESSYTVGGMEIVSNTMENSIAV